MKIIKKIWILMVKLCGWKLNLPKKGSRPEVDRCIFVVAPHTSALDFIYGAAFLWACSENGKVMIKKEFFFWPLGPFLKKLGCISIDRGNKNNEIVDKAIEAFDKNKNLSIAMTPEATRQPKKIWKHGFWDIAKGAGVPIVPAYWDFEKKEIGIFDTIWPSDNYKEDLKKVQMLYTKSMAKHPELYYDYHDHND